MMSSRCTGKDTVVTDMEPVRHNKCRDCRCRAWADLHTHDQVLDAAGTSVSGHDIKPRSCNPRAVPGSASGQLR